MINPKFLNMSENTPIITFKDADILNGEATVIYSLDMEIYPSDFVYIVGKSAQARHPSSGQ